MLERLERPLPIDWAEQRHCWFELQRFRIPFTARHFKAMHPQASMAVFAASLARRAITGLSATHSP